MAMQRPENEHSYSTGRRIEKRLLSVEDAMQSEFARSLLQCFGLGGLDEVPLSKLIESAVLRFEQLGIFEKKAVLRKAGTVAYFLHILQSAEIVEEAGVAGDKDTFFEPILRLSEKGKKLYQKAGQETGEKLL